MNDTYITGIGTTGHGRTKIGEASVYTFGPIATQAEPQHSRPEPGPRAIGIVTILPEEANPVIELLDLKQDTNTSNGQIFYTGSVEAANGSVPLVLTQTLDKGQRSVGPTLDGLRDQSNPGSYLLVGIAGGIHPDIATEDVVIATRVVYYDAREVNPGAIRHRGQEHPTSAAMANIVNSFFTHHGGEPATVKRGGSDGTTFRAFTGLIGSGEASLRDPQAETREYLSTYNHKVLAVDMEAGGFTQWCHQTGNPHWLVIRGISDHANQVRSATQRRTAAVNAAHALCNLIPCLRTDLQ